MMKDSDQGKTGYCAQCEELARKVEELQRHVRDLQLNAQQNESASIEQVARLVSDRKRRLARSQAYRVDR